MRRSEVLRACLLALRAKRSSSPVMARKNAQGVAVSWLWSGDRPIF